MSYAIIKCMHNESLPAITSAARATSSLALRGIDPALRSALEAEAARLGTSLNAAVLGILRRALGLSATPGLHHDLDALAGAWSREEAAEFVSAIAQFEEIDPSLWTSAPEAP